MVPSVNLPSRAPEQQNIKEAKDLETHTFSHILEDVGDGEHSIRQIADGATIQYLT